MTRALKNVMTKNVVTIESHSTILEAARIMSEKKIGGLPVLENERAVGIIASYPYFVILSFSVPLYQLIDNSAS